MSVNKIDKRNYTIEDLEELLDKIMVRKNLKEYGMKEEDIEVFAESVIKNQQRLLSQAYIKFTKEELANIYRGLF